jgi:hypothetical protein
MIILLGVSKESDSQGQLAREYSLISASLDVLQVKSNSSVHPATNGTNGQLNFRFFNRENQQTVRAGPNDFVSSSEVLYWFVELNNNVR